MRGRGYGVVRLTGRDVSRDVELAADRALRAGRGRVPSTRDLATGKKWSADIVFRAKACPEDDV